MYATADLVDAHEAILQSCAVPFRRYGGRARFRGPVRTLRTFEDNARLKQIVSNPGEGAVLVVDGGGSLRAALVGDVIAGLALANGWAGLVLWGAVRDTLALASLDLGIVRARLQPVEERQDRCRRGGRPGELRRRHVPPRRLGLRRRGRPGGQPEGAGPVAFLASRRQRSEQ